MELLNFDECEKADFKEKLRQTVSFYLAKIFIEQPVTLIRIIKYFTDMLVNAIHLFTGVVKWLS